MHLCRSASCSHNPPQTIILVDIIQGITALPHLMPVNVLLLMQEES